MNRFWSKVDVRQPDSCWPWQAYRARKGYGIVRWAGRNQKAHRVAYQLEVGEIPAGLFVCHRCDNPPCVNPAHLFLGTTQDNTRDMMEKGRGTDNSGEKNPRAKLTWEEVEEIRARRDACSQKELAEAFGVSVATINQILVHRTWRRRERAAA